MKYIVILSIVLTTFSCNKSDIVYQFNPPDWLIGTWDHENELATLNSYIITKDNVVLQYASGELLDYSQKINTSTFESLVENEITDTKYSYTIEGTADYRSGNYKVTFDKINDNQILLKISTEITGGSYYNKRQ